MEKNMIELYNVTKRFGEMTAVNNIDLTVKEGEFLTFLGPSVLIKVVRNLPAVQVLDLPL